MAVAVKLIFSFLFIKLTLIIASADTKNPMAVSWIQTKIYFAKASDFAP
jgi:hypothetical protein